MISSSSHLTSLLFSLESVATASGRARLTSSVTVKCVTEVTCAAHFRKAFYDTLDTGENRNGSRSGVRRFKGVQSVSTRLAKA
jgi:hypothetical protein